MKKILLCLLMAVTLVPLRAQEFLTNDNYVYGMGATDNEAVYALAKSICVSVTSEINYTVESQGNNSSEYFRKDIGLSSSMVIRNSRQYIDGNGKYYRYINKAEYILKKEKEYFSYLAEAERLEANNTRNREKHEINLILGYYYKAYCAMSEPLTIGLLGDTARQRCENAISLAKLAYTSGKYGRIILYSKDFNGYTTSVSGGYVIPTTAQPADLFGFEYSNGEKWDSPKAYFDKICWTDARSTISDIGNTPNKSCLIKATAPKLTYRILYEYVEGGKLVKLPVPETWYFEDLSMENPRFLN